MTLLVRADWLQVCAFFGFHNKTYVVPSTAVSFKGRFNLQVLPAFTPLWRHILASLAREAHMDLFLQPRVRKIKDWQNKHRTLRSRNSSPSSTLSDLVIYLQKIFLVCIMCYTCLKILIYAIIMQMLSFLPLYLWTHFCGFNWPWEKNIQKRYSR